MSETREDPTRPADQIALSAFRQVFQWPLILDPDREEPRRTFTAILEQERQKVDRDDKWKQDDPLTYLTSDDPNDGGPYGEFIYFHDFTQRFLYPQVNGGAFDLFRREDIKFLRAEIVETTHVFTVERLTLHLFRIGIAILTLELRWKESPNLEVLNLAEAQRIIDYLRRSYTPFFAGEMPKRVPGEVALIGPDDRNVIVCRSPQTRSEVSERVESTEVSRTGPDGKLDKRRRDVPVFAHWSEMIAPLELVENGGDWRDPSDERIPCHSFISLAKDETVSEADTLSLIHDADWIRIADAEEPGDFKKYPYNPDFLEETKTVTYYDRFFPHQEMSEKIATRHLFGGAHYAMVGTGSDFENIFQHHFRRHYTQLALIARFQQAALLGFSSRITRIVEERDRQIRSGDVRAARNWFDARIQEIQDDFLSYTHRFHFTGVSSQIQAGQMFGRWRISLGLDRLHDDVKSELDSAAATVHAHRQTTAGANAERLSGFAAFGVTGGLIVGALGSNVLVGRLSEHSQPDRGPYSDAEIIGVTIVVACGLSWLFGRLVKLPGVYSHMLLGGAVAGTALMLLG